MDKDQLLNSLLTYFTEAEHPQINKKKEINIVQQGETSLVAFYINNIFFQDDNPPVMKVEPFVKNGETYLLYRIMNINVGTRFIHQDPGRANMFLNQVLLDIPLSVGSKGRICRTYDQANILIDYICSESLIINSNNQIVNSKIKDIFADMLNILNKFQHTLQILRLEFMKQQNLINENLYNEYLQTASDLLAKSSLTGDEDEELV